ncbi:MAG: hypothetical protein KJP04_06705 [Arenicella sp.]|nr:hypothetical protein [Arenicella sp.]
MNRICFALILCVLSVPAVAELDQATARMCEKIKTCSLAEIEKQDLPAEMAAMMTAMFDGMCVTWVKPFAQTLGDAGLEKKAEACIDSMVAQSCETLMQSEGDFTSPECEEFQQAADDAGVDLES